MSGYQNGQGPTGATVASQAFFPGPISPTKQPIKDPGNTDPVIGGSFFGQWEPLIGVNALAQTGFYGYLLLGNPTSGAGILSGPAHMLSDAWNQPQPGVPTEAPVATWIGLRLGPSHRAMLLQGTLNIG